MLQETSVRRFPAKMSISVVIPAYNEEKRIEVSVNKVMSYLERQKMKYEIIVVDDGSSDRTAEVVEKLDNGKLVLLRNRRNRGKGFSVRRGILKAKMDYILFSDADLSSPITELPKLLRHMKKYDIAVGSRRMARSRIVIKQPWYRSIPGRVFPLIVYLIIIRGIRDTQCGFKLFRKPVAHTLFKMQRLERFSFDAEILLLAKRMGYSIKEVPVTWVNALDSKLNAVTDSYGMFVELIKVRWNLLRGKYSFGNK
jgi:dolichyl-phosphate beta-glucosyltransferase